MPQPLGNTSSKLLYDYSVRFEFNWLVYKHTLISYRYLHTILFIRAHIEAWLKYIPARLNSKINELNTGAQTNKRQVPLVILHL